MLLLARAQRFNATVQVTGLLLLTNNVTFLQTIEGRADAVSEVYERIVKDVSHNNIVVFADESITRRVYGDWAMMGVSEHAAPAVIEFLSYALLHEPTLFTTGQLTALTMTQSRMRAA